MNFDIQFVFECGLTNEVESEFIQLKHFWFRLALIHNDRVELFWTELGIFLLYHAESSCHELNMLQIYNVSFEVFAPADLKAQLKQNDFALTSDALK